MKDMLEVRGLDHLSGKDDLFHILEAGQNEKQLARAQIIAPDQTALDSKQNQLTEALELRASNLDRRLQALNRSGLSATNSLSAQNLAAEVDKSRKAVETATAIQTPNEVVANYKASVNSQLERAGHDPEAQTALERILGVSDLLPLWYLSRGLQAAQAVGLVCLDGVKIGTGFLVGRQLLLTNNHVLGAVGTGEETVKFDYTEDEFGHAMPISVFKLRRDLCLITSPADKLDFTLIGVEQLSDNGMDIEDYGFLRLNPETGKIQEKEAVAIIGHPNGETKQIALRDNRVLKIGFKGLEHCLWYTTDTLPGNSGSPVFNDQWQVVALHHKAIPEPCNGRAGFKSVDGQCQDIQNLDNFLDTKVVWIANEGIRISAIVKACQADQEAANKPLVKAWLADLDNTVIYKGTRLNSPVATFGSALERTHDLDPHRFNGRQGYNPDFLSPSGEGDALRIDLFELGDGAPGPFTPLTDGSGVDLKYMHSTIRMSQKRKLAYYTAVNIDGEHWVALKRERDVWQYDDRIPREAQAGPALYSNEPGAKGWFDRGHLVRRQDPIWGSGEDPQTANDDTFVWTNCSPQHWSFNQSDQFWLGLENFILSNVSHDKLRATVFSGPVFTADDEAHRGIQIPKAYWKIVAVVDEQGQLHASAYSVPQDQFATDITFERVPVGQFHGFQLSIVDLEKLTHLQFGNVLKEHDAWRDQPEVRLSSLEKIKWRNS
ncbi:DNA/RNA non-specific endonuclease [Deinococcus arenicola]|uniref:DNA/RNA non-specific endonuclease n=1 Tax=Deinococcus arenicola TaxID=2994950 RepID=A0ABU4DTZ3_9DEIO|nr:DNA/RNA non-specific endonuclease [Deinococcus sp. ZS9-10]MDV6375895.1 DNA/RNA non-specific endonuclease [Deinococcus sp. ZS9-10]